MKKGEYPALRIAHFDCFSGISGDMTLAALFDAGVPVEPVRAGLASLGLPITLEVEKIRKGGFAATQVRIEAPEEVTHRHLADIETIISRGNANRPATHSGAARSFAVWPRLRRRSTVCRWRRFTSMKSGHWTVLPTSSGPPSDWIFSASSASAADPWRSAAALCNVLMA